MDHQTGDAGGGGGGKQRVQKGDALPGLGGHRQTQQAGADQNLKEKAQNHHLGRGDAIMFQKRHGEPPNFPPGTARQSGVVLSGCIIARAELASH